MLPLFMIFIIVVTCYIVNIIIARRGREIKIREIHGLSAIDEAIGRVTEMGKPLHFTLGLSRFYSDTFAAFAILKHIATRCALMNAEPIVTNSVVTVHLATEEIVRSAYKKEGYSDRFHSDMVRFIAKDPFAYAAGALGVMEREGVSANIMIGTFGPATLLMAEGGRLTNAIQIAGTDDLEQLPFYFICCDYTIIGEEIYGAGAQLSKDPNVLGSLRGQDIIRYIIIFVILISIIFSIIGFNAPLDWFFEGLR